MTVALLCACSPTLDWREVRPEGSAALALFPCKPSVQTRTVQLGAARARMTIAACRAGGATYAIAFADVADPAQVAPALGALRASAVTNWGASGRVLGPMRVPGMTPNTLAERLRFEGKLPSGEAVSQEAGFLARGTRVWQVSVMGQPLEREAVETFFENLKLQP